MNIHSPFWLFFLLSEIALALIFLLVAYTYDKQTKIDPKSIFKGILERIFLTICLVNNYPHALTLFGALKLGTRLKRTDVDQAEGKGFNDYYLLGNMASVAAAIFYTKVYPAGL